MITPHEIVLGLKEHDRRIIEYIIVSIFPVVKRWVLRNQGTVDDSKDVFHDGLLIVMRNIQKDEFSISSEFSTYFIAICKHRWHHELKNKARITFTDSIMDNLVDNPYDPIEDEKYQIFLSIMDKLDLRSKELIKLVLEKKSQPEIAALMNFKNVQAVADKKKNCIKKIISELRENMDFKELQGEI
jgi:RNA polymerase sigma factor (sigma-70 family)